MIRTAVILAGGLGTRLRSVVNDRPKSMALINGRPFLEYQLDMLISQGIEKVIFSVGHKSEHIENHFGVMYKNCFLHYSMEETPLGTGGAIYRALLDEKEKDVFVLNGDSMFLVELTSLYERHLQSKADATLSLKQMENFERYGTVTLDENSRIKAFEEKAPTKKGLINGGVYILNVSTFLSQNKPGKFSLERDFYEAKLDQLRYFGYVSNGYFLDIGIPSDYEKAQDEFKDITFH